MEPLELLYERDGGVAFDVPAALRRDYAGAIGFPTPRLIANFVSSIDGVVDDPDIRNAPAFVSGRSEEDRFVMALLRACAGAVLIGAGTLRAEPEHRWTPSFVFPGAAQDLAALRATLGLAPDPELAVVTSSGRLDPAAEALGEAVILTTGRGAEELNRRGVEAAEVMTLGDGDLDVARVLKVLRERGHGVILTEAGPRLTAQLLRRGVLDELFLTISPVVLGRDPGQTRPALADGGDLVPAGPPAAEIASLRRGGSHLFLRYLVGERRRTT